MAKDNPHSVHYWSHKLQNELTQLIASEVKRVLIKEINYSVYCAMMFDKTPDRARREQMSRVLQYVHIDWNNKAVVIKKSFEVFIEVLGKDAKSISEVILKSLENDGIDLDNFRCRCYNNAAVMSGHVSGVQKLIIDKNSKSIFTNCDKAVIALTDVMFMHLIKSLNLQPFSQLLSVFGHFSCAQLYDEQL